ncbi:MAG: hypothetical protein U9R19_08440 [Bacteroidota bacterium]|nr:hypothetical protein [Bacteroidota bacterium]
MTFKNVAIKSVAFLMIGVMGMLVANKAAFMHTHKLNDGTIISHAHPFDKSNDSKPYKSHHHTNAELLFFQNIEVLFLTAFLAFALFAYLQKTKLSFHLIARYTSGKTNLHQGRASPVS